MSLRTRLICLTIFSFLLELEKVKSARILAAIAIASYSHQLFYQPFWKELANRGHEVVLITTNPINDPTIKNLKEIDLSSAYQAYRNSSEMIANIRNDDKVAFTKNMMTAFYEVTRIEYAHPEIQQLYKSNEHFDLLIIEHVVPSMFIFKHKFDVPVIGVTSLEIASAAYETVGNPRHSILYPQSISTFDTRNLFGRLATVLLHQFIELYVEYSINPTFDEIAREAFGEDIPSVSTLSNQVDMLFTNANPMINANRPFTPATISIAGGFHEVQAKPLPKELKDFLDSASDNGVIYFSLGSHINSNLLPTETLETILETFAQLPYKVLWKFETDELPGKPDNVKIMKWVPQQDVLKHKNIKLFVTQAGLQSLEESLYAHVPLVALPFVNDQEANAHHMEANNLGIQLDHKTFTVEKFKSALIEVITNDEYRKNVKKLADLIQDQPMKPLDKAIWWTEYVIRHKGAKHFHGRSLPLYQILYLDIFAVVCVVLMSMVGIMYFVCKKILYFVNSSKRSLERVEEKKTN